MLIERIENETLVRIPNAMLDRTEVQVFISFLKDNTAAQSSATVPKTCDQFEALLQKWHNETALLSSGTAIVSHAAYTQIIGMGEVVIPFILMQLQKNPQHLFLALFHITGENPIPLSHAGNLEKMTADWLDWGYKKGYLN